MRLLSCCCSHFRAFFCFAESPYELGIRVTFSPVLKKLCYTFTYEHTLMFAFTSHLCMYNWIYASILLPNTYIWAEGDVTYTPCTTSAFLDLHTLYQRKGLNDIFRSAKTIFVNFLNSHFTPLNYYEFLKRKLYVTL